MNACVGEGALFHLGWLCLHFPSTASPFLHQSFWAAPGFDTGRNYNSESKPVTFTNGDRAQTRFMQSLLRKQARLPPTPKSGALLLACVTGEPWGGRGEPLEEPWLHSLSC